MGACSTSTPRSSSAASQSRGEAMARARVADALATILPPQTRVEAYDGSVAGSSEADVVISVKSPQALAHLVSAPGELGMARAYVSGEMDLAAPNHYLALKALTRV